MIATNIFHQVLEHALRYPLKQLNTELKNKLTTRELEVLRLAATGLNNKLISEKLYLSIPTIKGHMMSLFSKLNASSRTEAIIIAKRKSNKRRSKCHVE